VSDHIIYEERLFDYFKRQRCEVSVPSCDFQASKGPFNPFKDRHGFHNMQLIGESASLDYETVWRFLEDLCKLREGKSIYRSTSSILMRPCCWKRVPERTFLSKKKPTASGYPFSLILMFQGLCGIALLTHMHC
jgi:hypothetical protein